MAKLICLAGKSGAGKDSVYRLLLDDKRLVLSPLVLYTTRPMRRGEIDGQTYHFVSEEGLAALSAKYPVVERRVYQTVFGPWTYATLDDGTVARDRHALCIVTPEMLAHYTAYFGPEQVVALYIEVEDGLRLRRAIEREERQANPAYGELCRRFLADERDFSEEILSACNFWGRYNNVDLPQCAQQMAQDLLSLL